jgi:hypothetical protein
VATNPGKSELLEKLAQKIRMNIPLDEKMGRTSEENRMI